MKYSCAEFLNKGEIEMFELELELSQCQLFKHDLKQNLINKLKPYCEFTDMDRYLFNEGTHKELYKKFGLREVAIRKGYYNGIDGILMERVI